MLINTETTTNTEKIKSETITTATAILLYENICIYKQENCLSVQTIETCHRDGVDDSSPVQCSIVMLEG